MTIPTPAKLKHFKLSEFDCPCCKKNKMNTVFLNVLDSARAIADTPFNINSGYRCPAHNAKIKGSPHSSHMRGMAVDIATKDNVQRGRILKGLIMAGFQRIGIDEKFIHADLDYATKTASVWLYSTSDLGDK